MITIFISHASEDKDLVVRPLAELLREQGYEVWYDEFSLKLGDSLRRGIDSGLAKCSYGIVVLSHNFFGKEWPQKELDALTTREASEAKKLILPVWHAISSAEVSSYSPMLADKVGVSTEVGLKVVVGKIVEVIGPANEEPKPHAAKQSLVYSFVDQNVLDWRSSVAGIFDGVNPSSKSWTSLDEIIKALQQIAEPSLNHCFFPSGGGMDLVEVAESHEDDCLELRWSRLTASVIKPKELRLEIFPGFPSLSYFRLQADFLEPWSDDIDPTAQLREELAELAPLDYRDRWVLDAGYYDHDEDGYEIPTPKGTRVITRYFGGSFVFFAKGSAYNRRKGKFDGYNAQHNKMSADQFRRFIADLIRVAAEREIELEPDRR